MSQIDIVITNYNRSLLVQRAIKSILDQTFTDFKLYVYDDGSDDDSIASIEKTFAADSRCYLIKGSHTGVSGTAKNFGAFAGSSPYLAFVDSDDYIVLTTLSEIFTSYFSFL